MARKPAEVHAPEKLCDGKRRRTMQVQPYLMFGGRCEEAVNFYRGALGAEIEMLMRFREAPDKPPPGMVPDNWDDKVMHCAFKVGPTMVMATDGGCTEANQTHQGYSLALSVANEAEAKRMFAALSEGGQVTMPLGKTFFSASFGILTDRFGVSWMVVAEAEPAALAA
jgi:PhnB protein